LRACHTLAGMLPASNISSELIGKRLELLRDAVPGLSRVAIMWDPDDIRGALLEYKATEEAARSLRLQLQSVEVRRADDIDRAFSVTTTGRAEALIVVSSTLTLDNRGKIAGLALKHRLPSMYGGRVWAEAGGLMAYGSSLTLRWRRAAIFVDKILKGDKPGELAVEQPIEVELVINMKTAKALGLTLPPSLLQRAHDQL